MNAQRKKNMNAQRCLFLWQKDESNWEMWSKALYRDKSTTGDFLGKRYIIQILNLLKNIRDNLAILLFAQNWCEEFWMFQQESWKRSTLNDFVDILHFFFSVDTNKRQSRAICKVSRVSTETEAEELKFLAQKSQSG